MDGHGGVVKVSSEVSLWKVRRWLRIRSEMVVVKARNLKF